MVHAIDGAHIGEDEVEDGGTLGTLTVLLTGQTNLLSGGLGLLGALAAVGRLPRAEEDEALLARVGARPAVHL